MTESTATVSRFSRRLWTGLLALAVVLPLAFGLLVFSYLDRSWITMRAVTPDQTSGQAAAPDFRFATFEGARLGLGDLAGQAIVLNFWASWCVPCRTEMPAFESAYRANRDRGITFVGLAVEDSQDSARTFVEELDISYPTGPDVGNEVSLRYGVTGLPTTVFIARDGTVARRWLGVLSEQQLVAFVEEIAR